MKSIHTVHRQNKVFRTLTLYWPLTNPSNLFLHTRNQFKNQHQHQFRSFSRFIKSRMVQKTTIWWRPKRCQIIFLMTERRAAERILKSNQIKNILNSEIAFSEISFPFNFLLKRAMISFLFLLVLLVFLHGRFGAAATVAVQATVAVSCFNFTQSFFITPIISNNRGRK